MPILNGQTPDADDITKNVITFLQGINQATILSQNATVTDMTYDWCESDIFSDSNGYNNNVDTGNSTARFVGDRYILSGTIYDNFDDNSLDAGLWTTTTDDGSGAGTATISETNQKIEIRTNIVDADDTPIVSAYLDSDTNYTDYLRFDLDYILVEDTLGGNVKAFVSIGGTTIVDKGDGATYDDFATGTWEIFKTGASEHKLYKNQVLVRTISSALSGAVRFGCTTSGTASPGSTQSNMDIDDVYLGFDSSAYVQTNAKTFSANVDSLLAYLNSDTSLSNTSVDIEISTDGGTVFEKQDVAVDTVHTLDGDNTNVVLRINLKASGTSTPWIYGYAYQGWS